MTVKHRVNIKICQLILLIANVLFLSGCTIKEEVETFNVSADGPFHTKFKLDNRYYNGTIKWDYFEHEFEEFKQYKLLTKCRSFQNEKNKEDSRIIGDISFVFEQPVQFKEGVFVELNAKNQLIIKLLVGSEFYTIKTNENNLGFLKIDLIDAEKQIYKGEFSAQLEENELFIGQLSEGEMEFILE